MNDEELKALKTALPKCCNEELNVECNDKHHIHVKCMKCGKDVESISPIYLLFKWYQITKEKENV